ncbi:hypothetical protein NDU88_002611 [Pleurodeles waltl]|uniref:Uncharacterized protein n=1 Tax=Pleurodeles waltl TaxID=8319 RepID=A0AAV7WQ05_PLEWA|nr:hypothetical protein NDU88_002611 [Pleurodeles waltl]
MVATSQDVSPALLEKGGRTTAPDCPKTMIPEEGIPWIRCSKKVPEVGPHDTWPNATPDQKPLFSSPSPAPKTSGQATETVNHHEALLADPGEGACRCTRKKRLKRTRSLARML